MGNVWRTEGALTAEPRLLPDGKSLLVSTFNCGLYLVKGLETPKPSTRLVASFGFMESPNVPATLAAIPKQQMSFAMMDTSFFLSRRSVRASKYQGMPVWQDKLFIMMAKNANDASSYFRLPPGRVIEVGSQVTV